MPQLSPIHTHTHAHLPPPPRPPSLRWTSIAGPNFPYFLHVFAFSLFPIVLGALFALELSWATLGTIVPGHFSYVLIPPTATTPPRDQMQVQYRWHNTPHILQVSASLNDLQQIGMPAQATVIPGRPLFTATVPVRVLQLARWRFAEALLPWAPAWHWILLTFLLALLSAAAMIILHGELFLTLSRAYRLVKHGLPTHGTFLGTHETGWWEYSDQYGWTYIRRCYADYSFTGPDHREHRGCELVLGYLDPATLPENAPTLILYNPQNPNDHIIYPLAPFHTKTP